MLLRDQANLALTAAVTRFPKGSSKGGQFAPGKGGGAPGGSIKVSKGRAELTAARKVDAKIGERTRATPYGVGRKTTTIIAERKVTSRNAGAGKKAFADAVKPGASVRTAEGIVGVKGGIVPANSDMNPSAKAKISIYDEEYDNVIALVDTNAQLEVL